MATLISYFEPTRAIIIEKSVIFSQLPVNIDVYWDPRSSQIFENDFFESLRVSYNTYSWLIRFKRRFTVILRPFFVKNDCFLCFSKEFLLFWGWNQTKCFLGVFASRYEAKNWHRVSPYYLQSLCKVRKKTYFIFLKFIF